MSTSLIAIEKEDGSIDSVLCDLEGYAAHTGKMLLEHYNNQELARKLIALGDLDYLHEKLCPETKLAPCQDSSRSVVPVEHSQATPHHKVTVAYHRDGGDELRIVTSPNQLDLEKSARERGAMYIYIWREGKWWINGMELTNYIIEDCD